MDPASYRRHYETTATRIAERLAAGQAAGVYRPDIGEAEAWAVMGMNVFLGLRYAIWTHDSDPSAVDVAAAANALLERGIAGSAELRAVLPVGTMKESNI